MYDFVLGRYNPNMAQARPWVATRSAIEGRTQYRNAEAIEVAIKSKAYDSHWA